MEMDSSVLVEVVWKCLAHFELQQYIEFKYPHSYIKEQLVKYLNKSGDKSCDISLHEINNNQYHDLTDSGCGQAEGILSFEHQLSGDNYETPPKAPLISPIKSGKYILGEIITTDKKNRRRTGYKLFDVSLSEFLDDDEDTSPLSNNTLSLDLSEEKLTCFKDEREASPSLKDKKETTHPIKDEKNTSPLEDKREMMSPLGDKREKTPLGDVSNNGKKQIILLDSDDEDDSKLEQLFSNLRLESAKKEQKAKKILSQKSLSDFIVSDSEDVEEEEEEENHFTKPRTPVYAESPISSYWGRNQQTLFPQKTISPGVCSTPVFRHFNTPNNATPLLTPSSNKRVTHYRTQMVRELFELFNKTVFKNQLPRDMNISWNKRLRTTAGWCVYKKDFNDRQCKIELSTKVCDTYERIRDTLIHELCHAATWIIDGNSHAGHGPAWKKWTRQAVSVYPNLTITTCHSFEISYKYTYQCTECDYKIGRHSKSINLLVAKCPYCMSSLELFY